MEVHVLRDLVVHVLRVLLHLVLMNVLWLCHFIILKTVLAIRVRRRIELLLPVRIDPRSPLGPASSIGIRSNISEHLAVLGCLLGALYSVS